MPRQFSVPWGQTTPTPRTHHPKSHDGNSTYQTGIPEDHPQDVGEGDRHRAIRDRPQEEEAVGAEEAAEEEEGEHFPCQDTHLPSLWRNFSGTPPRCLQEIEQR